LNAENSQNDRTTIAAQTNISQHEARRRVNDPKRNYQIPYYSYHQYRLCQSPHQLSKGYFKRFIADNKTKKSSNFCNFDGVDSK
jgi:hypothetical protein